MAGIEDEAVALGVHAAEAVMPLEVIFGQLDQRGLLQVIDNRCKAMLVRVEDVAGKSRTKAVVRARHAIWLWMHDELGFSWPEVAHLFGRRDHSSIIQARGKQVSRARKREDDVAEKIAAWLEDDGLAHACIDPMVRLGLVASIRAGDWRGVPAKTDIG